MDAIGPGDWVERIADGTLRHVPAGTIALVLGVVERVEPCSVCGPVRGLLLDLPQDFAWCVNHWRPIYRPKSEIIEALKQPAPELEPA